MTTIEFLRQFKLGEYAIFDLVASFLGIYLLSPFLSKIFKKIRLDIPKINWIYLTLPIGILAHLLIGKITPMTRDLLDLNSSYLLKILIVGLLFFGLKNVKIIRRTK